MTLADEQHRKDETDFIVGRATWPRAYHFGISFVRFGCFIMFRLQLCGVRVFLEFSDLATCLLFAAVVVAARADDAFDGTWNNRASQS